LLDSLLQETKPACDAFYYRYYNLQCDVLT